MAKQSNCKDRRLDFVADYDDPTTNVYYDVEKKEWYEKILLFLKCVQQEVKSCVTQGFSLISHWNKSAEEFARDGNFLTFARY